ncbi:arsenate reductase/protein-tyrosine-phosphatase family protein [Streptomyces gilvus]|uniref:arsenate reductase/protein-tyrosine-phosphatase family protein n=1 Tax=Streptomyces gilvus TaxID=2920937 RepID=UPI0035A97F84
MGPCTAAHNNHSPLCDQFETAATACGYDLSAHRGLQITADLIARADSILAMDGAVNNALQDRAAASKLPRQRLCLNGQDADVPDPYGSDPPSLTGSPRSSRPAGESRAQHLRRQPRTPPAAGARWKLHPP